MNCNVCTHNKAWLHTTAVEHYSRYVYIIVVLFVLQGFLSLLFMHPLLVNEGVLKNFVLVDNHLLSFRSLID